MAERPGSATTAMAAGAAPASGDLVARCVHGDQRAFAQLVACYQDRVASVTYRLLGWRGDVEDVVQDVFVTVLQNLPRFRAESQLATWIYRITVNECRRARRKSWLRLRLWRHAPEAAPAPGNIDRRMSERVRAAVRALPARYREVVVLRYLEELPIAEIGQLLDLKPNTVEVRLTRARAALRTALADLMDTSQ